MAPIVVLRLITACLIFHELKKSVTILLLIAAFTADAKYYGWRTRDISLLYGVNRYRNSETLQSFELMYDSELENCLVQRPYHGISATGSFGKESQEYGIRIFGSPLMAYRSLGRRTRLNPYLFVQGIVSQTQETEINRETRMNLRPGIGINANIEFLKGLVVKPNLSLGYSINDPLRPANQRLVTEFRIGLKLMTL